MLQYWKKDWIIFNDNGIIDKEDISIEVVIARKKKYSCINYEIQMKMTINICV